MMIENKTEKMILAKFRHKYPQGSLTSELIEIDRGTYIVKALVQVDNIVLATALASAVTVEEAEDTAKERAIATLFLDEHHNITQGAIAQSTPTKMPNASPPSQDTTLATPAIEQQTPSNHQIVNFSKSPAPAPQATQESISAEVLNPRLDLSAAVSEPSSKSNPDPPISNNLFGDTYSVETPPEQPLTEDQVGNSAREDTTSTSEMEAMDFNEIKQKTDIEIRRLNWTKDQGKEFLMSRYGKRSRLHLTDEQLLEFLRYLEKLPNPVQ